MDGLKKCNANNTATLLLFIKKRKHIILNVKFNVLNEIKMLQKESIYCI